MKKLGAMLTSVVLFAALVGCSSETVSHEGEAYISQTSNDYSGENITEVVEKLKNDGFTDIQTVAVPDLITGWLTKDGDIDTVSINDDPAYLAGQYYPLDSKIVIHYHTFADESDEEEQTETEVANEVLTITNNEDFKSLMATDDISMNETFASKYDGRTIEFDGCVVFMDNHRDYDTRFDILIDSGNYVNADTDNPGPTFSFRDVNMNNLGIDDLFVPEFLQVGKNVHVVAKVIGVNNSGLIELDAESVTAR